MYKRTHSYPLSYLIRQTCIYSPLNKAQIVSKTLIQAVIFTEQVPIPSHIPNLNITPITSHQNTVLNHLHKINWTKYTGSGEHPARVIIRRVINRVFQINKPSLSLVCSIKLWMQDIVFSQLWNYLYAHNTIDKY